jgi:dUTP pyrophosphatase
MNIREESNAIAQAILNAIVCYGEGDNNADVLCNLQDEIYSILRKETKVKVYREHPDIPLPEYQTAGAACCDLYVDWIEIKGHRIICHTGLHVELPESYEMEIRPRSGLTKTKLIIANSPGTVDADYRGEILVIFESIDGTNLFPYYNNYINNGVTSELHFPYGVGDRCAQLLIRRYEEIAWHEVDALEELGKTKRGNGGHGSTGK